MRHTLSMWTCATLAITLGTILGLAELAITTSPRLETILLRRATP